MKNNLLHEALAKYLTGLAVFLLVLFVPAGTIRYRQAWLLTALLFVPMLVIGIFLLKKNPVLLRKRLNDKETEPQQRQVVLFSMGIFLASFILAGLHIRFRWKLLPSGVTLAASAVFLAGYALYAEVIRENAYLSRVVEVQKNQKVVDTGLYGIVRHPMYASTVILFLMMPLVLGSIASFIAALMYLPIINRRICNEEEVLEQGLEGYSEYKKKVKYKVIPFIW
ncbi:MAG: isoprenylcysteine carboxylmethyltransferase family protein [Lachnospiraceae bacterium]|nr:isoprenylcysteine carboxylmethyltransferase family protein [Lachnospiraceae bacterium]